MASKATAEVALSPLRSMASRIAGHYHTRPAMSYENGDRTITGSGVCLCLPCSIRIGRDMAHSLPPTLERRSSFGGVDRVVLDTLQGGCKPSKCSSPMVRRGGAPAGVCFEVSIGGASSERMYVRLSTSPC